jgi:glycosyltransferase involved in cell wall biosynthesis
MKPTVTVIIPTVCDAGRAGQLQRAIASVLVQQGEMDVELILVVNGNRFDPALVSELKANPALKVVQIERGNVSVARHQGLLSASGQYFCFLDDDDELLPGGLAKRVALMQDGVDVVVTNGFWREGQDAIQVPEAVAARINAHVASSFLHHNWFASPASMFRAQTVEARIFDITLKYFEWTHLFFSLLSARKKIHYDNCLTYRKHDDTPMSVSKSAEYEAAYPAFIHTLMQFDLDAECRQLLRNKYVVALNSLAQMELARRNRLRAWAAHLKCLFNGGWKYLPYTRRLLL